MIRVLVVDDDFHVAHAHAIGAARLGFEVVGEAHTAAEAEAMVADRAPDLMLLDMYLPDRDALSVMRNLAASPTAPDVIVVTAARDVDSIREAIRLGAFYYLVKPFAFSALREQLMAYAQWRTSATPSADAVTDQRDVDRMFGLRNRQAGSSDRRSELPETMRRVLHIVADAPRAIGASEIADQLGASRPTAQRHLAGLVRRGLVELELSYGSAGRPEHRYATTSRGSRELDR